MELSKAVQSSITEQKKFQNTVEALDTLANALRNAASDMGKSITNATTMTSQIMETAAIYKEALQSTNMHPTQAAVRSTNNTLRPPEEHKLSLFIRLERKARQILPDSARHEDQYLNTHKIKEKAEKAIASISPPPQ